MRPREKTDPPRSVLRVDIVTARRVVAKQNSIAQDVNESKRERKLNKSHLHEIVFQLHVGLQKTGTLRCFPGTKKPGENPRAVQFYKERDVSTYASSGPFSPTGSRAPIYVSHGARPRYLAREDFAKTKGPLDAQH